MQDVLNLKDAIQQANLQYLAERNEQAIGDAGTSITGSLSVSAPVTLSKADMTGAMVRGAQLAGRQSRI